MLRNDAPVLTDHDAVGIGLDLDRAPDGAGCDRVLVVVEAYQAGLRDRRRHRMEAVEPAGIGNELGAFGFEHFPDRLLGQLRMAMRLGVGNAFVEQPGVQLVQVFEPQPRREEAFPDQPDLVLDLALLPARGRRAGDRIDQVVAAHLQEAAIVAAILADEDRLDRRLHVVVDAAAAGALEQGERPVVGVEHHLLRLARIGPREQHAAVAKPDMGDLHDHRHAVEQDDLVAPVELVGFSGRKAQRDIGRSGRLPALLAPSPGVTPHGIVTAVIAAPAQLFEDPDQRQLFASGFGRVRRQQSVELRCPSSQLRPRLDDRSYSNEVSPDLSTFRTVFRDTFRSRAISLIVLPLMKCSRRIRAIVSTTSIPDHLLHSKAGSATDQPIGGQFWTPIPRLRGSILQAE